MTHQLTRLAATIIVSLLALSSPAALPGTELWHFNAPGPVSSPAIGPDGTIYFTAAGYICALDPMGSNKWSRFDSFTGTPTLDPNGTIYIALGNPLVGFRALDPTTSASVWVVDAQAYDIPSQFAIASQTLYFPAGRNLFAVNRVGSEIWTLNETVKPPTIALDGSIYYVTGPALRIIHPNGKLLNQYFMIGGEALTSPAIGSDGTIYCGYEGGRLCAVNPDLTRKWLYDLDENPEGIYQIREPAIGPDGTIYFPTLRHGLCAMSPSGTNLWKFKAEPAFINFTAPAIAQDGTIYIGYGTNFLAINPDGTEKWHFSSRYDFHSSPAIAGDGTVYVGSDDGHLYAFQGTAPLARSAWPMEGHDLRRSRKASCIERPCFDAPFVDTAGVFDTTFIGDESREYRIMTSADLITWTFLTNCSSANGASVITDESSPQQGFYKAVQ